MRTVKSLIRLGGCPGWSESSLGAHATLLVLSRSGSFWDHYSNFLGVRTFRNFTVHLLNSSKQDSSFEPPHNKTNKMAKWHVRPAKTHISLGICPVWSESSLSTWRKLGTLATHWAHSEDSDQTGRMPRPIWVFVGRTVILLVLSWGGSFVSQQVPCFFR